MSHLLTAEEIFASKDLKRERLELEDWGGHLYIRTMTGEERDAWEVSMVATTKVRRNGRMVEEHEAVLKNLRARLISVVACDDKGAPIFSAEQVQRLGKKSASCLDMCFDVAKRLNHLTDDDVEELAKNSDGVLSDCSGTD